MTPSISHIAFSDLDAELAGTRRILERVPDGRFDWKPHTKSMSLGRLASHVASLPSFAEMILTSPDVDLAAGTHKSPSDVDTRDAALQRFDETAAAFRAALAAADDAKLTEVWTLSAGPRQIYKGPRYEAVRRLGINHIIHHRDQLGVYLRLLDVPVPGMYGPSADER